MKTSLTTTALLAAFALVAPLQGAVFISSFEASEGFVAGTATAANHWNTFPANGTFVSNAYSLDGALSLAMSDTSGASASVRPFSLDRAESYTSLSYSFISPGSQAATGWHSTSYVNLLLRGTNTDGESAVKSLYIRTTVENATTHRIALTTGAVFGQNFTKTALDFERWNTISVSINVDAQTISLYLNGVVIAPNLAISSDFVAERIEQLWLMAPSARAELGLRTTYYDNIAPYVVPEPGATALLGLAGGAAAFALQRRRTLR